jgi:23S rRNA pseudouridine1911/1915/1917 synthase
MSAINQDEFVPVYEDNHLIAVSKAAGLLVQGDDTGDEPLTHKVAAYLKAKYQKPGNVFVGLIHRIDRPVSGLVLLAKTSKALERLNEAFSSRKVKKTYLAAVEGIMENSSGTLENWMAKNAQKNTSYLTKAGQNGAKKATLSYRLVQQKERYALLEVSPETGRHHQIRLQLSAMGHSIVGDLKYGAKRSLENGGIGLHAYKLSFEHPVSKENLELEAPLPGYFPWNIFTSEGQ